MSKVLPILFNTAMVRAILDGRKSTTRRPVKGYTPEDAIWGYTAFTPKGHISCRGTFVDAYGEKFFKSPCQPGDILYVRETFAWEPCWDCGMYANEACYEKTAERFYNTDKGEYGCYMYKASHEEDVYPSNDIWHPSIHMPKAAARIWLKVTDVRVERLKDIGDCTKEGVRPGGHATAHMNAYDERYAFMNMWYRTIKPADYALYGWDANPWVWVIEFERCEKPESEG